MTNKPSKKEKTIEKIVQLACVAITIAGCLLFGSCETEPCVEAYYDGQGNLLGYTEYPCPDYNTQNLSLELSSVDTFEGEWIAYETLINGEVSDTCETTWAFNTNGTMRIDRNLPCIDGPAGSGLRQFSTDDNNLYITIDGYTAPYPYTIESNGDLTLTSTSGDFVLTYKLTR